MVDGTPGDRLCCEAITKTGQRCKLRPRPGTERCSRHPAAPEVAVVTPMATATEHRGPDDDALYAAFGARTDQGTDVPRPRRAPAARAAGLRKGSLVALAIVLLILVAMGRAGGDTVHDDPLPRQVDGMLSEVGAGSTGGLDPHESIVVAFLAGGRPRTS
jgi:hypothetical protein